MVIRVKDVLKALDDLTNGRCMKSSGDFSCEDNPFVVTKTSNIPGKAVTEMPGLVWGNPEMEVKKIAVMMTMTESAIELAAATGVDAIVTHHPIADASNSGGVLLKNYLGIYHIAAFELHEAFHGMHPGIPWLHGHKPFYTNICYDGIAGNIVHVGEVLTEIETVDDMLKRLDKLMNVKLDEQLLYEEKRIRKTNNIYETAVEARCKILVGSTENKMKKLIHMFPHTGFTAKHLEKLVKAYPDVDTLLASISRVYPGNELITKAEELGLNFICGNSHAVEIFENGVPMANAIKKHLPDAEVVVFRERMTSIPLEEIGSEGIRKYAEDMSVNYLHRK